MSAPRPPIPAPFPADAVPAPGAIAAGDLVVARAWKYDAGPHWVVPGVYLGADAAGHWIFQPAGSFVARPGAGFFADSDAVCLFPHQDGDGAGSGSGVRTGDWVATFYDEGHPEAMRVYIDVSTAIGWRPLAPSGWEIHSVDMDLDVVGTVDAEAFIDDEDEFDEHTLRYGYPDWLVDRLRPAADELLAAVREGRGVFAADADTRIAAAAQDWFDAARSAAPSSAR
ncbi:DUF402 domain-containing protein [Zhihengliuella salsuginis]|uniref:DUF402 domain-containing protein n=1 Tax=Zhihengliuella salsuginis TaxID=578222 RepID=A0ABQ3GEL9_9MICC|nr:DUF402 domain-containing protein [Zhihengliuella salsuginis]GHD01246.1 hypothetical protein GCM10008096_05130 [Zhihengliuella salsuginis]